MRERRGGAREILSLPLQSHCCEHGSRSIEKGMKGPEFARGQDDINRPYSVGVAGHKGNCPRHVESTVDGDIDGTGL